MKKIIVIIFIILLGGCYNSKKLINKIEIDNNKCTIIKEEDSHGGFLGDGDFFAIISCSNIDVRQLSSNWKKFPLPNSLDNVLKIKMCYDEGCKNFFEKYNLSTNINGYYYFYDRHSDALDRYDSSKINERSSYNFTLAILDISNNKIYFYELDT